MVLVHTSEDTEQAWYETDRGILPASPEVTAEANSAGRQIELRTSQATSQTTSHGKSAGERGRVEMGPRSSRSCAKPATRILIAGTTRTARTGNALANEKLATAWTYF